MNKQLALALLAASLASCATVPTPLQGQFSAATPRAAAGGSAGGELVRWGGDIIKVEPKNDSTCFEVLARDLDASARPLRRDPSGGRFIACRSGFYDPVEFEAGRQITVVGRVDGTEHGKVGQFDYTYPRVAADTIYLWPKRPLYVRTPYYDPWMYDCGPYGWGYPCWGPYWGPYWGPSVIVRERPARPPAPRPAPSPRPNPR
ncbi:MAG: Slp/YeaY family lipoprotein [Rhodanobacteraceae bacterium]|jgi:outer membrane lipoprotein|nr:Slp/YeaY family lipoprotein [Rhodanobacteraceae bacterium]